MLKPCAFCSLLPERIIESSQHGMVVRDGFPISPGHTLIIPKRHIGSFFELETDEQADLLDLLRRARAAIEQEFYPQGYNIGINDGAAAGQTIPHLNIHLVSRYQCDRADPAGRN